ncbi:hypothetical protein NJBCHELONAE_48680 [Mycobacteroides chelonae]|uniref:hypothetical protein n=1 Tax=Mycobacteroides chelonae TaxID=1774 RepID=UPI0021DD5D1B|nr:hypothetical protein [Mycobacteroides chelonae]GLE59555.1 hypothetical protein NJBCHELONAE_48680 [Mycobacteroides chelonae]
MRTEALMARKKAVEKPRPEYLVTTPAFERPCSSCRASVLHALCGGWPTYLDPSPINAQGEAVALVSGLTTYELVTVEDGREPVWRHAARIRKPWPSRWFVHADHRCGFTWPPTLRDGRELAAASLKEHPDF